MSRPSRVCDECGQHRVHAGCGLCTTCYRRHRRVGTELPPRIRPLGRVCQVSDCGGPIQAQLLCGVHYMRMRRHGDPNHISVKVRNRESGNALIEQCKTAEALLDGECWEWPGALDRIGRGVKKLHGTPIASRAVWIEVNGPIVPESLNVCHKCDNPPCVRPSHLFLGTQKDNIQDMLQKGREYRVYGDDHHNIKLTDAQIEEIRELRATSGLYLRQIAALFGVDGSHIGKIVRGDRRTVPAASTVRSEHRNIGYGAGA